MVGLVNKEAIDKLKGFLAENLAAVQFSALREEQSVVAMLVNAILQGHYRYHCGTARTILFNISKGMAHKVPLSILVQMDSYLHSYLAALLVAALYKVGDAIRVP